MTKVEEGTREVERECKVKVKETHKGKTHIRVSGERKELRGGVSGI